MMTQQFNDRHTIPGTLKISVENAYNERTTLFQMKKKLPHNKPISIQFSLELSEIYL